MDEVKTEGQKLQDKLGYTVKNAWEKITEEYKKSAFEFCEGYKSFLDKAKTEREFVVESEKWIRNNGFISLAEAIASGKKLTAGTKVYYINKKKSMIMAVLGNKPLTEGVNILGAHIDSPRLDLKQNPLYEETGMAFLKTHYYGGIKKYQWVTIPLAIHGVVVKTTGEVVDITIGEDDKDPIFTITDLLPHLAQDQMQKKMSEGITGEGLNILLGSIPLNDEKAKDKVKLNILKLLNDKYGIIEEDFVTAELELVPAYKARDIGLDRSLIGGYGQDDRVCAYPAVKAILDIGNVEKTAVCVLTDKEEIGSTGNTGAEALFFQNFLAELLMATEANYNDLLLRRCLDKSRMLSADVNAAMDPNYDSVFDKRNSSYIGKGIVLQKYTGSRGKAGASDANPEFIAEVRSVFNNAGIFWQTAELGKVDQGGGGTIAQYVANLGTEVLDCGVAVLSMHAPYEVTSKIDVYVTYDAYKVFLKDLK